MAEEHKFHLVVKKEVAEIYIHTQNGLIEMTLVKEDDSHTFNGTIPKPNNNEKLILLGEPLETEYTFERLFSLPLDLEAPTQKNFIVVNTPHEVKYVIIETPPQIAPYLGLPKNLALLNVQDLKINLFPEGATNREKLAKGIDPQARNFIISYELQNKWDHALTPEFLKILETYPFKIKCYFSYLVSAVPYD